MSFRLYEMHILIPVFQFTIQFSLIRAPSCRKPIVVPVGSNGKLISVSRVFALRAVLEERIKLVNRGITVRRGKHLHAAGVSFYIMYAHCSRLVNLQL
jgi:hypothetical protein